MRHLSEWGDGAEATEAWNHLAGLARNCTDFSSMRKLARLANDLEKRFGPPPDSREARLALIGGATMNFLVDPLRVSLLGRGIAAEIHLGQYDQWIAEMLDAHGPLATFKPKVVVVGTTLRNVPSWPEQHDSLEQVRNCVDRVCDHFLQPCRVLHERHGCEVVLTNFHAPLQRPMGHLGAKHPGDPLNFIRRLNLELGLRAPDYVHLFDVAALAERIGTAKYFDLRYWYHAKQPVSFDAVPEYARNLASVVGAVVGRTYKLVVLDLDNTLWGGVIGDDGMDGIELGEGSALGEAHKAFQLYLRSLRERGVLLAVCSKNDESTAREAIREHPEMVLREDDFVAFKANWSPKSENLAAMARELNLGLADFVFVDDNPAEREQVRQSLPQVAVPEIGDDPSYYTEILEAGRFFEVISLTEEDRQRTKSYRQREAAGAAMSAATDMSSYLDSLEMRAVIRPFESGSMERITQLTNKTNQFNLTTRRVTRTEIEELAEDPNVITLTARVRDRFGDHGLISVFWGRVEEGVLEIESWLMSCRVINRGVPELLFNQLIELARERGIRELRGTYIPTQRNGLVRDLYGKVLGFSRFVTPVKDGTTRWSLRVEQAEPKTTHIEVESE